ncbi:hypothetical protein QYF36_012717 [Acer negundo]|nr:hypothetical protein QYF36_012717 [Acer negundo]
MYLVGAAATTTSSSPPRSYVIDAVGVIRLLPASSSFRRNHTPPIWVPMYLVGEELSRICKLAGWCIQDNENSQAINGSSCSNT